MSISSHALPAAIAVLWTVALAGQAPNAPPAVLANATGLNCAFTVISTGDWKNGNAEATVKPSTLSVAFRAIDTQDGTAEAVGDSGKSHITVRLLVPYLSHSWFENFFRILFESVEAVLATEIVGLALVLVLPCSLVCFDLHAAYWVGGS